MKVLDLVIGEFDDGLESEIEAGKETQIKRNVKNWSLIFSPSFFKGIMVKMLK